VSRTGGTQLEVGITRSIDRGYAQRRQVPALLVADRRAALANGSMVRGAVVRVATGMGMRPVHGDILLAQQVSRVMPPLGPRQTAVAWEVTKDAVMDEAGWRAPVVGIREGRTPGGWVGPPPWCDSPQRRQTRCEGGRGATRNDTVGRSRPVVGHCRPT
jgi:hypothetical protein